MKRFLLFFEKISVFSLAGGNFCRYLINVLISCKIYIRYIKYNFVDKLWFYTK